MLASFLSYGNRNSHLMLRKVVFRGHRETIARLDMNRAQAGSNFLDRLLGIPIQACQ